MLQLKKNTGAKVVTLAASVAAAASIFGLVRQNAPAASASTAPAQVQANIASPTTAGSTTASTQTSTTTATTRAKVTTRTRAS